MRSSISAKSLTTPGSNDVEHPTTSTREIRESETRRYTRVFGNTPRSTALNSLGGPQPSDRFDLDPQAYLHRHHIKFYLQDAIAQLDEATPSSKHIETISAYFQSVISGTHLNGRDFAYVSATPHNRRSFVHLVESTFSPSTVNKNANLAGSPLSAGDAHGLLQLLCHDIPPSIAKEAASAARCGVAIRSKERKPSTAGVDDPKACQWKFEDFIQGLHITFVHLEFIRETRSTIFTTVGLWSSTSATKCLADFRFLMRKVTADGQAVPFEDVVRQAVSFAFRDAATHPKLSQAEVFIGRLCNSEVMTAHYRAEVSAFTTHAAAYAAANALSNRMKRVEIIDVSTNNVANVSNKPLLKRSKSAPRRRPAM